MLCIYFSKQYLTTVYCHCVHSTTIQVKNVVCHVTRLPDHMHCINNLCELWLLSVKVEMNLSRS